MRYAIYESFCNPRALRNSYIETSEKRPFIVAAVGRPPHFSSKLKSAALCREAATLVLQRSHIVNQKE
jgi:hypothetical protein